MSQEKDPSPVTGIFLAVRPAPFARFRRLGMQLDSVALLIAAPADATLSATRLPVVELRAASHASLCNPAEPTRGAPFYWRRNLCESIGRMLKPKQGRDAVSLWRFQWTRLAFCADNLRGQVTIQFLSVSGRRKFIS